MVLWAKIEEDELEGVGFMIVRDEDDDFFSGFWIA